MGKAILQLILLVAFFLLAWFGLSQIDFTGRMDLENLSEEQEQKLGDLMIENMIVRYVEVEKDTVDQVFNEFLDRICEPNDIEKKTIKIHIVNSSEINAFTFPGRHMVIFSGLIEYCENPEELLSVMAHEIAHMEHNHIMQKLTKEIGLAMILAMVGGESSAEIIKEVINTMSSRAFDRSYETEADASAVKYLENTGINPENFANFLFRLSQNEYDIEILELLSTHPDSEDRAAEILTLKSDTVTYKEVMDSTQWEFIRETILETENSFKFN